MIRITLEPLATLPVEGVMRPVRSDLSPVSAASRDLGLAAGEAVEARLQSVGALPLCGAVMTPGGALAADFVIHVVVMSVDEPQTSSTVRKAVQNGLRRATDVGLESLALPPIGLGVGVADPETSARSLLETLLEHLAEENPPLDLSIVVTSEYESDLFSQMLDELQRGA